MKKLLKMLLCTVTMLLITSCELDDSVYVDCDCGNVIGWTPTTITIDSDCGTWNTYYNTYSNVYINQYVCF